MISMYDHKDTEDTVDVEATEPKLNIEIRSDDARRKRILF
jgi:hypothetical protein